MSIRVTRPPTSGSQLEMQQWLLALYNRVIGKVDFSGDADAEIASTTTYHGVTALTAARTLTAPATSDMQDGDTCVVQDESGQAGSHTITIQAQGADTINGASSVTITTNFGRKTLVKRGPGEYFAA
jgi:hypothetical protein